MIHEGTCNAAPALIETAEGGKVARVALLPLSYELRRTADGQIAGVIDMTTGREKSAFRPAVAPRRFDPIWHEPDPFDVIQITRNTLHQTSFLHGDGRALS